MATAVTCTPIKTAKITPGNKTATGGASPGVSSRPVPGRDRLTADELDSAKASHIDEKPQPDWVACWADASRPRTLRPDVGVGG